MGAVGAKLGKERIQGDEYSVVSDDFIGDPGCLPDSAPGGHGQETEKGGMAGL